MNSVSGVKFYFLSRLSNVNKLIESKLNRFTVSFFRSVIKSEVKAGKIRKAAILSSGIKKAILELFIKIVWGSSYLKFFKKEALEQFVQLKLAHPELKKKIQSDQTRREHYDFYGADRFKSRLPHNYLSKSQKEVQGFKGIPHTDLAAVHLKTLKENPERLAEIASGDGNHWTPLRITKGPDGNLIALEGKVCPTSERALEVSDDLTNIYIHLSDDGHLTITCGVIDGKGKADQFMAAVTHALKKYEILDKPLRIVMHQLNSKGSGPGVFVSEHNLIAKQHQMVAYINRELDKHFEKEGIRVKGQAPYVAHVNRCLNGFTRIPGEDEKTHPINREGIATQMQWFLSDLQEGYRNVPRSLIERQKTLKDTMTKLQIKQLSLHNTLEFISKFDSETKKLKEEIALAEAEIIKINIRISDLSTDRNSELSKLLNRREEILSKAFHLDKLIDQKDYRKLVSGSINFEELLSMKKYDQLLDQLRAAPKYKIGENIYHLSDLRTELKQLKASQEKMVSMNEQDIREIQIKRDAYKQLLQEGPIKIDPQDLQYQKAKVKEDQKEIKRLEAEIEAELQKLAPELYTQSENVKDKELKAKFSIASSVLAMQLGKAGKPNHPPKLSPAEELAYQLLFDHVLGAATEINCKSGLDRTGFARALQNVIEQRLHTQPLSDVLKFFVNFKLRVKQMDLAYLRSRDTYEWLKEYAEELKFQQDILAELLGVAMPITGRSTGLEGLKWHHDKKSMNPFEKNPHPLPFLPIYVINHDGNPVEIIKFDTQCKREFTPEGNALLMRLSTRRGG